VPLHYYGSEQIGVISRKDCIPTTMKKPEKHIINDDRVDRVHPGAIFVLRTNERLADKSWDESIRNLGWSMLKPDAADKTKDFQKLDNPGLLLMEHAHRSPGQPLLIVRAGICLTSTLCTSLLELLSQTGERAALTVLSNAESGLNPYAGLDTDSMDRDNRAERDEKGENPWSGLVALLGPGLLHEHINWPEHLLLLSAGAISALASSDVTKRNAMARLNSAGGSLLLSDSLFALDPLSELNREDELEAHEQRRPPAWGLLTARLDSWLIAGGQRPATPAIDSFERGDRPASLHVTHSWGGGVEQWVSSFIDADDTGLNFQLRSEGPQTGYGTGQRLTLYIGNHTVCPIASWWLQPPIQSTDDQNAQYRKILEDICERYGIARIIISSLVGHCLAALRTELPTVQVLHDYYPCWPLLGVHPEPYLREKMPVDLGRALLEHKLLPDFSGRDERAWTGLRTRWLETINSNSVSVVAPSRSVAETMPALDPGWARHEIEIVPHGMPPFPDHEPIAPRSREDGRLRLVIPGRIQEAKGQSMLLAALPELTRIAQVYLIGAGKDGEAFFGQPGVNVILHYDRQELPSILSSIGPHLAALLSVVPETFSYTLSEMFHLGLPVIATQVGSLEERIADGETGWLIEPRVEALVSRLEHLFRNQDEIESIRFRLSGIDYSGTEAMVRRYAQLCPPNQATRCITRSPLIPAAQSASLAFESVGLKRQQRLMQQDVKKYSKWARERDHALKDEQEQRRRWVAGLETQIKDTHSALEHEQASHAQLRSQHEWVLASWSWRLTRPFRVVQRMLTNFMHSRAWNPSRWPLLISQLIRTLKTQGVKGVVVRSQLTHQIALVPRTIETDQIREVGDPNPPRQLPVSFEPKISIVIPVHNKWAYTAACLRSLAETACLVGFEVIVVDDKSSDETAERLGSVKGLISLHNNENMGFVDSCNRGVEKARGEYIVLLNNDTQVLNGWLDALLKTFERYPDTGLAGARLIYPDGSLQEAGGIVFSDGSGWNYGRGDIPDRPEYLYVSEVDYCSGACIMLRTDVYRHLGGLDARYAPAYYEDTDLAFRIRELGLKARFQPAATVVHFEGITSGTDVNSGTKRFQNVNREKFLDRWKEKLASYPDPIADPTNTASVRRARDHHIKGRVLVIDACTPEPDQDSGSLRLRYLLQCFVDLGYGVTFFADNRGHAGRYSTDLQQSGIEVYYSPWIESLTDFFSKRGPDFDYIMISRHYVAANYISLIERYCPGSRFLFDTVDLHYLREERLSELENSLPLRRTAAQTRRSELSVIDAAAATIVVSAVEKSVLEKDAPDARVHVISNIHQVVGSRKSFADRKDIIFVGGYRHPPNVDAAQWFVGSIWPLIREQLPTIEFHLIGSKAPEQVRALHGDGVVFHGYVPSLEPWLDGCRLAVAPLRYGAGVKGKVNMSMSRGQPVVATPMAVEGLFAQHGKDLLIADSEQEFANEVVRLYSDEGLWNRLSAGGLENVQRYFSVENAKRSLKELLQSLE
jgi:GT2 family glycosyltransferase